MQNTGSFIKGMATGAVIGAGMSMIVSPIDKRDIKRVERKANKMFSTIGSMVDSVIDMWS